MNRIKNFALLAIVASGLAACGTTQMDAAPMAATPAVAPAPMVAGKPPPVAAAPSATPVSTVTTVTLPAYLDPKNSISTQRSVYFDYDVFTLRPDDGMLIERHGKYLASHPTLAVKIEGNSDERGGSEYNLALGQKRAESVLRALKIYGVKDAQLEAVSWGEGKPMAAGHDEAAWAQNRRADLRYPGK